MGEIFSKLRQIKELKQIILLSFIKSIFYESTNENLISEIIL